MGEVFTPPGTGSGSVDVVDWDSVTEVGEDDGVEEGDGVAEDGGMGEDGGVVLTEVDGTFRMSEAGEDVGCPVDEGGRGVVTTLSSKMSFCAPLPKLYKSRYSGGE